MAFEAGIPSPSKNPFISVSSLPEGTLFISVGSILLGLIVIVLCWRIYAIWAAHRAARNNEARFTALEPSYGGPFVDPVDRRMSDIESFTEKEGPETHPIGVPLNRNRKPRAKSQAKSQIERPKSQVERMRDAQLQGKFFSPTADVLKHGAALPPGLLGGTSGGSSTFGYNQNSGSRLSVYHSGRNSIVQQAAMSVSDFGLDSSSQAGSSVYGATPGGSYVHSRNTSLNIPMGPVEGTANPPRAKKLRPPSTYLEDLVG